MSAAQLAEAHLREALDCLATHRRRPEEDHSLASVWAAIAATLRALGVLEEMTRCTTS